MQEVGGDEILALESRRRWEDKHLSTFCNLYRSTVGFCSIVCVLPRVLCNINKLSKSVKIFNDCVTANNRKSICSRRSIDCNLKLSLFHFGALFFFESCGRFYGLLFLDKQSVSVRLMFREHFRVFNVRRLFFIHLKFLRNPNMWAMAFVQRGGFN